MADQLRGIPDGAKVWKVGNDYYVVYDVPKSKGVRLAYKFRDRAEAASIVKGSLKNVKSMTEREFRKTGAIPSGQASLIANQSEHPWDRFLQDFKREARYAPWLRDADMMAVIATSILENRAPSKSEIQSTDWYRKHSQPEREALELYYGDRATWRQNRGEAQDAIERKLIAAGYDEGARNRVRDYFTGRFMRGSVSEVQLDREIEQASNPYATGAEKSAGVSGLRKGRAVRHGGETFWRFRGHDYRMSDLEQARFGAGADRVRRVKGGGGEGRRGFGGLVDRFGVEDGSIDATDGYNRVREMVLEEAGPVALRGWGDRQVAKWAQRIEENPGAENELRARLRGLRKSMYPGYDEEASYAEIAARGRGLFDQLWGQTPDETDPFFQKVLQINDMDAAAAELRTRGNQLGVDRVVEQSARDALTGFGGQVVDIGQVA